MFTELLSYDPETLDPEIREQVSNILQARSELLVVQAEVAGLRARVWAGEDGLDDAIDLKAADLLKLREDHRDQFVKLLKVSVDVEGLVELLPALGVALLQKFNIPLPVVLEASGADIDALKLLVEKTKELISGM